MATYVDPVIDAAEAYKWLRGLAHATRALEDPADKYRVLAEVSGSVRLLRQVLDRVMRAHEASGRIARHSHSSTEPERSRRWVNVVFLQGAEADEVLELIDVEGVKAGIAHLAQWDFVDETTAAAFVNGEVYDQLPAGQLDRSFEADGYVVTYNQQMGYVGLVREHPDTTPTPDENVVSARDAFSGVTSASPHRAATDTDWLAPTPARVASSAVGRSL